MELTKIRLKQKNFDYDLIDQIPSRESKDFDATEYDDSDDH